MSLSGKHKNEGLIEKFLTYPKSFKIMEYYDSEEYFIDNYKNAFSEDTLTFI